MITKIVKIIHESIGYLSGLILYYICIFIVIIGVPSFIGLSYAFTWLTSGFFGIFIIGGHYLLYSILMGEIERIRDIKTMKYLFLTYIVWIVVGAIIDLLDLYISDIYIYGGIIINCIVIFYFGIIPIIDKSNQVDQSD